MFYYDLAVLVAFFCDIIINVYFFRKTECQKTR